MHVWWDKNKVKLSGKREAHKVARNNFSSWEKYWENWMWHMYYYTDFFFQQVSMQIDEMDLVLKITSKENSVLNKIS